MSNTNVTIVKIRRINEITERAAGAVRHPLQNKPTLPTVDHPLVAKPMIQNSAETATITVTIIIRIRPDKRMFFYRRY